jgi:hypothetical protein
MVPWVSGPVLMFCTLRLVLGATEGVISLFIFFAPGLIFGVNEGIGYRFHVLRSRTSFGRYRWRSVSFSCFALPNTFWVVARSPGSICMFCFPRLISGGTEGVDPSFHVSRPQTCFRRYQGRRVPFSYFTLPDSFTAIPRASSPHFLFSTFGLVFSGTEGDGPRFHVLCSRTRFRRYLER